jgi:hypothetical protein
MTEIAINELSKLGESMYVEDICWISVMFFFR